MVVPKDKAPFPRPPPLYPQRLAKQKNENQFKKFIKMMKNLSINVPLVEVLEQMPGYAKFMKYLVTKNRSMDCETTKMIHQVSEIMHSMAPKLEDPGTFTIPCTIGSVDFAKALCDLGTNINLMPYSVFRTLGISQSRSTSMRLQMADRTLKRPLGIIDDVLIQVDKFILRVDFVILDCEVDYEVPIILGRPFLETGKALVDAEVEDLTFQVIVDDTSAMINVEDPLEALSLDLENRKTPSTKPSIEEPPVLELKPLPSHLRYEFLGPSSTLPVILSSCLTNVQLDATLEVLQRMKKAIGWTLADIRGINPTFCMHKIILQDDAKPSVEH
ncbi:uncharacterized protein [Nicotiana sylvestris]|uniref:uncharacterized protein n=1 Tax=Nicotiana sylvestris TaxID=4096 RepID=UPI00388CBC5B